MPSATKSSFLINVFMLNVIMLSVNMLNVIMLNAIYAEFRKKLFYSNMPM